MTKIRKEIKKKTHSSLRSKRWTYKWKSPGLDEWKLGGLILGNFAPEAQNDNESTSDDHFEKNLQSGSNTLTINGPTRTRT